MKPIAALALCVFSTVAFAQSQQPLPGTPSPRRPAQISGNPEPIETLPENYVLKLVVSDKDHLIGEFSMVIATQHFNFSTLDPLLTMDGDILPQDQGALLFKYSAIASVEIPPSPHQPPLPPGVPVSPQYHEISARTSVRLRLGEPMQILKSAGRTYELTVSKQGEAGKKAK